MSDRFIMSVRQASELDLALERNNITPADVKALSEGFLLAQVRAVIRGQATIKPLDLLKQTVEVPVIATERFVANEHLEAANVGWTGDNFKRLFLKKVEDNVPDAILAIHTLLHASLDSSILTELEDRAETNLAYLFQLLVKQAKGEEGVLLTKGCYANIFYSLGTDVDIWAVSARWNSMRSYWLVEANSVKRPYGWVGGYQVFSRKQVK